VLECKKWEIGGGGGGSYPSAESVIAALPVAEAVSGCATAVELALGTAGVEAATPLALPAAEVVLGTAAGCATG
jgi:hypothetical protein